MHIGHQGRVRFVVRLTALLLSAVVTAQTAKGQQTAAATTYEVYGVRFAGYHGFPVGELVLGADTARRTDLAFIIWVLKPTGPAPGGATRTVLFDAGFYRQKFLTQWKPFDFMRPSGAVGKVGVRPEDVTDIIISHIHWDHVDGADLFPRARVWLQRQEYEHYVDANGEPRARGIDSVDAQMLARLRRAGRIGLIDGDAQTVVPGITAYIGGRHTYASEYISVHTARGAVVLASDNVYMYENLARHVPIAATFTPADSVSNRGAQDRMQHLAADPRFILPGHDPAIFERFPAPGGGVALIQ